MTERRLLAGTRYRRKVARHDFADQTAGATIEPALVEFSAGVAVHPRERM